MSWQPGQTLEDVEKEVILLAIKFFQNNKTKTAGALGISIRTLDSKLSIYYEGTSNERAIEIGRYHTSDQKKETSENILPAESRLHLQPHVKAPEKQPLPMRKRT